jgi:hypothetical protein
VFENRVLRIILGPKRDEVTGEWRKLHNEKLHNMYSYPDIIRQVKENEVGWACGTHGRAEKSVQGFGGKARKRPLGIPRRKCKDGIRTALREIGWGGSGFSWLGIVTDGGIW